MRIESAHSIKRKNGRTRVSGRRRNMIPEPETKLREIYDLFMANRGKPVRFSTTPQKNDRAMETLRTYYGLEIENLEPCMWILRGEWIGADYISYDGSQLASGKPVDDEDLAAIHQAVSDMADTNAALQMAVPANTQPAPDATPPATPPVT